MTPKELYLAWLRSKHPDVYNAAIRKVIGKARSLGGLGQDLIDVTTSQTPNILAQYSDSPDGAAAVDAAVTQAASSGNDIFTNIANAVSSVANTYLTTSAQQNLLNINTDRARQGLPPVTANGVPVTAASLMPANAAVLALERRLAGAGQMPWLLVGIAALAAYLFFGRARARS